MAGRKSYGAALVVFAVIAFSAAVAHATPSLRAIGYLPPDVEGQVRLLVRSLDGAGPSARPLEGEANVRLLANGRLTSCADTCCEDLGVIPALPLPRTVGTHLVFVLDADMPGLTMERLGEALCGALAEEDVLPTRTTMSVWRVSGEGAPGELVVPPTTDRVAMCRQLADQTRPGGDMRRTPILRGLRDAVVWAEQGTSHGEHREIVLVTDAEDASCYPEDHAGPCTSQLVEEVRRRGLTSSIPVSVLLVGGDRPASGTPPVHQSLLESLAQESNGEVVEVSRDGTDHEVRERVSDLLHRIRALRWVRMRCFELASGDPLDLLQLVVAYIQPSGRRAAPTVFATTRLAARPGLCGAQRQRCTQSGNRCDPPVCPAPDGQRAALAPYEVPAAEPASDGKGSPAPPQARSGGEGQFQGRLDQAESPRLAVAGFVGTFLLLLLAGVLWVKGGPGKPPHALEETRERRHGRTPRAPSLAKGGAAAARRPPRARPAPGGAMSAPALRTSGGGTPNVDAPGSDDGRDSPRDATEGGALAPSSPSDAGVQSKRVAYATTAVPSRLQSAHASEASRLPSPIGVGRPQRSSLAMLRSTVLGEACPYLVTSDAAERCFRADVTGDWSALQVAADGALVEVPVQRADFQVRYAPEFRGFEVRPGAAGRPCWVGREELVRTSPIPPGEVLHVDRDARRPVVECRLGDAPLEHGWCLVPASGGVSIPVDSVERWVGRAVEIPSQWAFDGMCPVDLDLKHLDPDEWRRVSGIHFAIWQSVNGVLVRDLSANGAFCNGVRLRPGVATVLASDDTLDLSDRVSFRLVRRAHDP